jgi:butyrate response factor
MTPRMLPAFSVCKNLVETGQCRFGNKCKYAHGVDKLHRRWKTTKCDDFSNPSGCAYGYLCGFIHRKSKAEMIEFFAKRFKMIQWEKMFDPKAIGDWNLPATDNWGGIELCQLLDAFQQNMQFDCMKIGEKYSKLA